MWIEVPDDFPKQLDRFIAETIARLEQREDRRVRRSKPRTATQRKLRALRGGRPDAAKAHPSPTAPLNSCG